MALLRLPGLGLRLIQALDQVLKVLRLIGQFVDTLGGGGGLAQGLLLEARLAGQQF